MKFRRISTYIYIRMKTFRLTLMLLFISIAANADNEIFTTNNGVIVPNASFVETWLLD